MNEVANCQKMIKVFVNTYHHVRINQLRRLAKFYGFQGDFFATVGWLKKSGNYVVENNSIKLRDMSFSYTADMFDTTDRVRTITSLEKAFVILTDFITTVPILTHFPTHRFPVVIVFATEKNIYEIMYIGKGRERLAQQILLHRTEAESNVEKESYGLTRRIVIIDQEAQISNITLRDIFSYAIVDEDNGHVDYYPVESIKNEMKEESDE